MQKSRQTSQSYSALRYSFELSHYGATGNTEQRFSRNSKPRDRLALAGSICPKRACDLTLLRCDASLAAQLNAVLAISVKVCLIPSKVGLELASCVCARQACLTTSHSGCLGPRDCSERHASGQQALRTQLMQETLHAIEQHGQ